MIAYVVACWFGDRRISDSFYDKDRADYINWHLKQLEKLDYNLIGRIIFVLNDHNFRVIMPTHIKGIPVEVIRRENTGMSYGAWNAAYQKYKDEYEAYFFIEDDYIPVIDHFDFIFANKMRYSTKFVCSLYDRGHAAISNGLMHSDALEKSGGIVYPKSSNYGAVEVGGQVAMSKSVESCGFLVDHIAEDYSVPFLSPPNNVIYYGVPDGEIVLSPVCLEREKNV